MFWHKRLRKSQHICRSTRYLSRYLSMCPLANVPCVMEVSPTQGKEKKAHTKSPNPGVFLGFLKEIILLVGVFFWVPGEVKI